MPVQRQLPKFGFHSKKAAVTAEVCLYKLAAVEAEVIDLDALKKADIIGNSMRRAKVMLSGKLDKAVVLKGAQRVVLGQAVNILDLAQKAGAEESTIASQQPEQP